MEKLENDQLFLAAQQGSEEALTTLYLANKKLIYSLIKRYAFQSQEYEDLVSVGSIGLIKAIQNFKVEYNLCFSTYAVPLILGEIRRYFREKNGIRVSRGLKEKGAEVQKYIEMYLSVNQKEPTVQEIAQHLNMNDEDVIMALESGYQVTSLDKKRGNDEDTDLKDMFGEDNSSSIRDKLDIDMAMSILDSKEKLFIQLRYYDNLTQQEIGERFFMNQVAVSRMEKRILDKMKNKLLSS